MNNKPTNVQKGKAPMGPSKYTSKLAFIIKAISMELKAKVFPVNFLVNKGLNIETNQ